MNFCFITQKIKKLSQFLQILLFSSILLVCFSSCSTLDSVTCPYLISEPKVEIAEKDDFFKYAGVIFSLYNKSDKDIESFTVSFMIYDSDGNNPLIGSNCIVAKCNWNLRASFSSEFIISLDDYISKVPEEPFKVDFIYIREIKYSDGSSWKDPYGMFCMQEN